VVFEICERTDIQTDRHRHIDMHIAILRIPVGIKVTIKSEVASIAYRVVVLSEV